MTVVGLKPVKGPRVMLAGDKGMDQLRETGGVGEVKVMFKGPVMKTPPGSTEYTKTFWYYLIFTTLNLVLFTVLTVVV